MNVKMRQIGDGTLYFIVPPEEGGKSVFWHDKAGIDYQRDVLDALADAPPEGTMPPCTTRSESSISPLGTEDAARFTEAMARSWKSSTALMILRKC